MVKPHEENPIDCGDGFRSYLLALFMPTLVLTIPFHVGPNPPEVNTLVVDLRLSLNPVAVMLAFKVSDLLGPSFVMQALLILVVGHLEWYFYGYLLDIANFRSEMRRHKRQSNSDS